MDDLRLDFETNVTVLCERYIKKSTFDYFAKNEASAKCERYKSHRANLVK